MGNLLNKYRLSVPEYFASMSSSITEERLCLLFSKVVKVNDIAASVDIRGSQLFRPLDSPMENRITCIRDKKGGNVINLKIKPAIFFFVSERNCGQVQRTIGECFPRRINTFT